MLLLSSTQQDIYFDQLRHPTQPIYNIGARININGQLNYSVFEKAYEAMIMQHRILRCSIAKDNDQVGLVEIPALKASLKFTDYSNAADSEKPALQFIENDFLKAYNLESGEKLHDTYLFKISDDFHVLYSKYHHLLIDGWGTSLLFQRIVQNYNELSEHDEIKSEYPYEYSKFVEEDKLYIQSEKYQKDKAYWINKFETVPGHNFSKSSKYNVDSDEYNIVLKRTLYRKLNELAKQERLSTFHIIIGSLLSYLHHYYDQKEWVIGLPVLNRSTAIYKKTVGLFMGVSPLKIEIDHEETLLNLIVKIKNQLRADYRYQRFPIGHLMKELGFFQEEDKLFNINLSYEKHDYSDSFKGTVTKVYPLSHRAERNALSIYVREFEEEEDVLINIDYNKSYLNETQVKRIARGFEYVLEVIVQDAETLVQELDILSAEESIEIKETFNKTRAYFDREKTLGQLINEVTTQSAEEIALRDKSKTYTYRELEEKTNDIACFINRKFTEKHFPVGVIMKRSADLVLVLLGILKSGRAYIPLDPGFPKSRLAYILDESESKILIADENECLIRQLDFKGALIDSGELLNVPVRNPNLNLPVVLPNSTAYIIYTSGSTGNPKGVEITHRSLINFLQSMQVTPGIIADDLLMAVTTYAFDISILEFFLPLISGATSYVVDEESLSDPEQIIQTMKKVKPSVIQATPSFYQMLFNAGWSGDKKLKVFCGGDLLSQSLAKKLLTTCRVLWNMYGPTETTIWSGVKHIKKPEEANNIGSPIRNTSFFVLDQRMKLKPIGAIGSIYIGGEGLAKGYYKNKELTLERFVINPIDGSRIYNTGDVGRWTKEGDIIFLGRSDNQVKIRGYRIELAEIEKKIAEIKSVNDAVVVAKKNNDSETILVAYIKQEKELTSDFIKEKLAEVLPHYMIPGAIVSLIEYPLTPNKKVNRKALSERELKSLNEDIPPRTKTEKKLAVIWETLLGVSVKSIKDNFFALGGHSLKAVELLRYIYESFEIKIGVRNVFENPTLQALSKYLTTVNKENVSLITKVQNKDFYDLSPNQYNIWLACQREPANIAYNMYAAFSIEGCIHHQQLERAVNLLIKEQEILRTNFVQFESIPKQRISKKKLFNLQMFNSSESEQKDQLLLDFINKAFDLEQDLLLSAALIDGNILVFVTHHIILDAWGIKLLLEQLAEKYNAMLLEEQEVNAEIELSDILQFKDYSEWNISKIKENESSEYEEYWKTRLEGSFNTKTFKRDGPQQSFKGEKINFDLTSVELHQLAADFEITPFSLLLSTVWILVFRLTGKRDFSVAIPTTGRSEPEVQKMIGMMANTIIFRFEIKETDSLQSLAEKINTQLHKDIAFEDYPIQKILLNPGLETPLFDVMIAFQDQEFANDHLDDFYDFNLKKISLEHSFSRLPLTFNFVTNPEKNIRCEVEYDLGLFEKRSITIIIERYRKLISEITLKGNMDVLNYDLDLDEEKAIENTPIHINFNF